MAVFVTVGTTEFDGLVQLVASEPFLVVRLMRCGRGLFSHLLT